MYKIKLSKGCGKCVPERKKALNKQMLKEEQEKKIIKCFEKRKISFMKQ